MKGDPEKKKATSLRVPGRGQRDTPKDGHESTVVLAPRQPGKGKKAHGGKEKTIVLPKHRALHLEAEGRRTYSQTVVAPTERPRAIGESRLTKEAAPNLIQVPRELRAQFPPGAARDSGAAVGAARPDSAESVSAAASFAASSQEVDFYWSDVRRGRREEKYRLRGVRATGGMGTVLDVLDLDLRRRTVMKILLPQWRSRPDLVAGFVNEARLTGFLEHPHIIPVHELGLSREAGLFFTMKLAEGESLRTVLDEIKRDVPEYVEEYTTFSLLGIFRKVCDAVSYAHSRRLIHMDIKPHNILVGRHGEVFLTDWGVARVVGDPAEEPDFVKQAFLVEARRANQEHYVTGTPAYMAPEQAAGEWTVLNQRTDVFLLGATLYHMLTLTPPYSGADIDETLDMARRRALEPPQSRSPGRQIPEELCRIIMKAMSANQRDRYPTAEDLARDVDEVMAGKWRPESRKEFAAGELIMKQGDPAQEGYLILSGRVRVYSELDGKRVKLRDCGPGEIIGEMALISSAPRSASVEALEKTSAAVITGERFAEHLKNLPPYIEQMVSILATRLRQSSAVVHPYLIGDCGRVVARQARLLLTVLAAKEEEKVMRIGELERQIARDLGLPITRVRKALQDAINSGLIIREGDNVRLETTG